MNKKQVLDHLQNHTYCRIQASKIAGVGVFAIRDIPKGSNPFKGSFMGNVYTFTKEELAHLHPAVKRMIEDFYVVQDGYVHITECGLNGLDVSYFMNTSEKPNMVTTDDGSTFITTREIKAGEELTTDYTDFSE